MSTPFPVTAVTTGHFMRLVSEDRFPFAKKDNDRYKQWIVMMVLLANADKKTHHICMSHKEVAERAGMSASVVRRTRETLRDFFRQVGHGAKGIPIYRPVLSDLESVARSQPTVEKDADAEATDAEEFSALTFADDLTTPVRGIDPDKLVL